MDKEFQELKGEFSLTKSDRRKQEIMKKMKDNLLKRNGGQNDFHNEILQEDYTIDEIENVEQLYKIDGELNRLETSKKFEASENRKEKNIQASKTDVFPMRLNVSA